MMYGGHYAYPPPGLPAPGAEKAEDPDGDAAQGADTDPAFTEADEAVADVDGDDEGGDDKDKDD